MTPLVYLITMPNYANFNSNFYVYGTVFIRFLGFYTKKGILVTYMYYSKLISSIFALSNDSLMYTVRNPCLPLLISFNFMMIS
jgi:hypothetical protein